MTTVTRLNPKTHNDLAHARAVLEQEAAALTRLANTLGTAFTQAVDLLQACRGRVIVSGMGKSGHIGAKIAATLASTGTPAFFVHPGEASHGDLGMVTTDDVVIAISHSGETKELGDILAHCTRFGVALIALTGKAGSTLGRAATVCLEDGVTTEACPLNLAPTTSTTATLALGDALAVALMQRRGFQPEDFARYHPGGKLGARLMSVAELMVSGSDVPLCRANDAMDTVILEMTAKNRGGVGITDANGCLAGIITDGDLKRHMGNDLLTRPASDIMTASPLTIAPDMLASAAVRLMQETNRMVLFVVDDANRPVGLLQINQCLQAGVV